MYKASPAHIPRLNSTFPSFPPLSQNCSSNDFTCTACLWGKAARARGKAKMDVVKINPSSMSVRVLPQVIRYIPKFTGNTILGLLFNHRVSCNRTKIKGGNTMIGVELSTLLNAVSPTANVAAFLLFPRLCTSDPSFSLCAFSSSLSVGKILMPCLISSPRIRNTLSAPADATAANGTRRVKTVFVAGETRFRRGTTAFRPRATEQEAETARR